MARTVRFSVICLTFLLCFASLISCGGQSVRLHKPEENGYIPTAAKMLDIEISSKQAFVYDVAAGEYVYLKGENFVLYPASTTKLLTILYALTLLDPEALITPGDELSLISADSSIAYIKSYHTLSVEMLIEGMLLPSGNDASYALAAAGGRVLLKNPDADGRTAVDAFVEGMNQYGTEIGLCGSRFLTPDGNAEETHYSTVEDMTIIARLAAQNEIIMRYAGLASDRVTYASGEVNRWTNTNLLLQPDSEFYSPLVTGLKTGSLGHGKYSVIVTALVNETQYIIGIFGAEGKQDRFRDAVMILNILLLDTW